MGRKEKILSKAGRATLIKSVGLAMPVYAMQSTKLSNRLCSRIDGMMRDFWWGFEKVSKLLTETGNWDIPKLNNLFTRETVAAILKGGNPSGQGKDHWIWTKEGNVRFSYKSAYLIQALQRYPHCEVAPSLWNKLWNSRILERHKVMWWSILSNVIPVRVVLLKRFHIEDSSCPICGVEEESIEHLFLHCNPAFHLVVWVFTTRLDFFDALCGEAVAVCLALDVAKDKGLQFILVESVSKIVINTLNSVDPQMRN
uniref:Reverse transcriptase zinc-binding domain-containing protein n=1 Tax=Cannabis sativa TaxID=3483 RepID=A0A803PQ46_CANSA